MDGKLSESNICVQIRMLNHPKLYVIVELQAQIMVNTFLETLCNGRGNVCDFFSLGFERI